MTVVLFASAWKLRLYSTMQFTFDVKKFYSEEKNNKYMYTNIFIIHPLQYFPPCAIYI